MYFHLWMDCGNGFFFFFLREKAEGIYIMAVGRSRIESV